MEEWKKKRDSLLDPYDDQVMIASHRGKFHQASWKTLHWHFWLQLDRERIWLRWILL